MEKCKNIIPEYLGFITGIIDSEDLRIFENNMTNMCRNM